MKPIAETCIANEITPNMEFSESAQCTRDWLLSNAKRIADDLLIRSTDERARYDVSPFSGLSGIVLALHRASQHLGPKYWEVGKELLDKYGEMASRGNKKAFYLHGDLGLMTVRLTIDRKEEYLNKILQEILPHMLDDEFEFDDMSQGRAGILAAASWLKHVHGEDVIPQHVIMELLKELIERGKETPFDGAELMWSNRGTKDLGTATGAAGILQQIFNFPEHLSDEHMELAMETAIWMMQMQDSSGNFPGSSVDAISIRNIAGTLDTPVTWASGAAGLVHFMVRYNQLQNDASYKARILKAGELIWRYGISKNGPGLSDGIAGNAYALLAVWRATGEDKWLRRAQCFARLMLQPSIRQQLERPLHPYSLFDGWAGVLYLLIDLLEPEKAQLPLVPIIYAEAEDAV